MDKGGGNATLASEDDPLVLHATNIDDDNQVQASFARRSAFSQVRIHTFVCYKYTLQISSHEWALIQRI